MLKLKHGYFRSYYFRTNLYFCENVRLGKIQQFISLF